MLYIGVDLGGTGIKAGVVNERGEILSKGSTPTMKERPYQAIIRDIAALCEDVAKQANVAMADIAAIGVGVPGICDPKTGIIPFCTNLGWHEVPFVAEMGKYLPNRVVVDNDATVAGYAESIAGVSKGTKSSVFITLGTGVGGGIVINGKPYSGVHGIGSEIGHMIIKMDGEPCTCGNKGCFERYASATAIIREAKRAVEAGYWPLYRYNPAEEKPFKWETKEATASFQEFIRSENRYKSLFKTAPADAEALLAKAETDAHRRMTFYKNLGEMMK